MRQRLIGFALGVTLMVACGASAPSVQEYIIDVKAQTLRSADPKNDAKLDPLCVLGVCYAYVDADVKAIKKYIVSLEERLKACESK